MTVHFLIICVAIPSLMLSKILLKPFKVVVTADESKPGLTIPVDFLGFSYEKNVLALDHFKPSNTAMIQLMRHLGKGVLRFGANYVEPTHWQPGIPKSFSNKGSVLGPVNWRKYFNLPAASTGPSSMA